MANHRSRKNDKKHQGGAFFMTHAKKKSKRRYLPYPYPAFTSYTDDVTPEQIAGGDKLYWKQAVEIQKNENSKGKRKE